MRYKGVIFDLDGTILDTLEDLTDSVNFALNKNALPSRTVEEVRSFVGEGIRLLIERSVPKGTDILIIDNCFNDFKNHYKSNSSNKTKAYDGILELLLRLKKQNIKLAVVSNKADFAVQMLIQKYFKNIFDFATGEKEGIPKKPCPDSVFCAIKAIGLKKEECIYVGDSDIDVLTARNVGLPCVCVSWGFRDKEFLATLKPDYVVDYPKQILEILGD